jgi:glutamate-1-semialdehyde 2,1-aminomutase
MAIPPTTTQPDAQRVADLLAAEVEFYGQSRPRSRDLYTEAKTYLFSGVPMPWMTIWPGSFPVYLDRAQGARLVDVDGHEYIDFCLGDSAAMPGHSSEPAARAIAERGANGIAAMLPTEDSLWVGRELGRRFGLPIWQFTLSATDANRNAIRFARQITGRTKVLVFNFGYHGTVDEALVALVDGQVEPKRWTLGAVGDAAERSRVVEFNDLAALEQELAHGDVACVLTEPALTNIGIVLPEPGFHTGLRELTRHHNVPLIIDETHTMCAGPGGATREYGLEPDMVTMGKWLGSGVPSGALGMTAEIAQRATETLRGPLRGPSGVGGTVAGNALSVAAMRATLEEVLTDEAFEKTIAVADRWRAGVDAVIDAHRLPWHVIQMGCRAEYRFRSEAPRNGSEAAVVIDPSLDHYLHLGCLNRGILMTPFHNMALISPAHTFEDADRHTEIFSQLIEQLMAAE